MADQHATATGSAPTQADLWGERARDWADVMEGWTGWGVPVYRGVLRHVPMAEGIRVLDVGCGAGRFCRMAADRGARVSGLDATPAFVEIARERVPDGDLRVGEMEELPWADDSFDLVTGFNSFFIAADMGTALREAGRVARQWRRRGGCRRARRRPSKGSTRGGCCCRSIRAAANAPLPRPQPGLAS